MATAMMNETVVMHPVASRHAGSHGQGGQQLHVAQPVTVTVALSPSPTPSTGSTATATKQSTRRSPLPSSRRPQAPLGLSINPAAYPLFTTQPDTYPVRLLSARDLAGLYDQYAALPMREEVLFPWAHGGADVPFSGAAAHFGYSRGGAAMPPNYRGMTLVCAEMASPPSQDRDRARSYSIDSLSQHSSFSSSSSTSSFASSIPTASTPPSSTGASMQQQPNSLLVSSLLPHEVLTPEKSPDAPATFLKPKLTTTVNLRHFKLQPSKYATVSDVFVYGANGVTEQVVSVAFRVAEAQETMRRERARLLPSLLAAAKATGKPIPATAATTPVEYNVYIVEDPFEVFEREHERMVAVDAAGWERNKTSFPEREKEEMRVLTQASEIAENVWLGNSSDVPLPLPPTQQSQGMHRSTSTDTNATSSSLSDDGNPFAFAVCVEALDRAAMADPACLREQDQHLTDLENEAIKLACEQGLFTPEELDDLDLSDRVLRPPVERVVHLECLSTTAACPQGETMINLFVDSIVSLAFWIRSQAAPKSKERRKKLARRVLIHCGDGYTETSVLALAYIMLVRRCSAPDAYLWLQQGCDRSFFVYPQDVEVLERVGRKIGEYLKVEEEGRTWRESTFTSDSDEEDDGSVYGDARQESDEELDAGVGRMGITPSDSGYESVSDPNETFVPLSSSSSPSKTTNKTTTKRPSLSATATMCSTPESHPWFYGQTFDGHFPSRILPFLYLGNLNHASNALMLRELGITHVVSVGESALAPPSPPPFSSRNPLARLGVSMASKASMPTNSLWLEERLGNISVLDMKNVADDGIDSIRPHLEEALKFIESARKKGGKVLVHCRVGVSRSATIVIAYIMKFLDLDLASAYLLTRSRRLNILIQPNLPFMATLHSFEAELLLEKDARQRRRGGIASTEDDDQEQDEQGQIPRAGLTRSNRVTWSCLCKDVSALNEKYLC